MKNWNMNRILVTLLFLIGGIHQGFAQQMPPQQAQPAPDIEVSDTELENFVTISNDIRSQQEETQMKMMEIVQGSDLGQEKFSQIAQSYQAGGTPEEEYSTEDMEAFKEVNAQLQPLQVESQQNAMKTIEENDMEVQRFQLIAQALQGDQELQQRYMALVQAEQGQ